MAIGESHKGTMSKGQKREFVSGLRTMNERDADLQYVLGKRDTPLVSPAHTILITSDGPCCRTRGIQCVSVGKDAHKAAQEARQRRRTHGCCGH